MDKLLICKLVLNLETQFRVEVGSIGVLFGKKRFLGRDVGQPCMGMEAKDFMGAYLMVGPTDVCHTG